MENAFVIQKLSLEFARTLIEGMAEALGEQAEEDHRKTLIALSVRANRVREAQETLLRDSTRAYTALLQTYYLGDNQEDNEKS